jgi:hypothetical protein
MSAPGSDRLAALEGTLVAAAEAQAARHRRRRRRAVVLMVIAAPLVLAAAGSLAATGLFFQGVDQNLSALRDERLLAPTAQAAKITSALGARPRDRQSERSWRIGDRRVVGYTTRAGSFCFIFSGLGGGCLQAHVLGTATPVDTTVVYGVGVLDVFGLATDTVTSVGVRVHGVTHDAAMSHNAFLFESDSLGGKDSLALTLIVKFRDGTTRRVPMRADGATLPRFHPQPRLPGALAPIGDTAT